VAHKEREGSVLTHLSDPDANQPEDLWQQGQLVEVVINDWSDTGDGLVSERVVFVPDSVPGDSPGTRFSATSTSKTQYAHAKL